jgi:hypothetical protein
MQTEVEGIMKVTCQETITHNSCFLEKTGHFVSLLDHSCFYLLDLQYVYKKDTEILPNSYCNVHV